MNACHLASNPTRRSFWRDLPLWQTSLWAPLMAPLLGLCSSAAAASLVYEYSSLEQLRATLEVASPPAQAGSAWTISQASDLLFTSPGPLPSQRVAGFLGFSSIGFVGFSAIGSSNGQTLDSGFLHLTDAVIEPLNPLVDAREVFSLRFDFRPGLGQDSVSGVIFSHLPDGTVRIADIFPTQGDFVLRSTVASAGSMALTLLALTLLVATARRARSPAVCSTVPA